MTEILRGDKLFEAASANEGVYTIVMRVYDDGMQSKGAIGIRQRTVDKEQLKQAMRICLVEKACISGSIEWIYINDTTAARQVATAVREVVAEGGDAITTAGIAEKILSLY